MLSQQVLDALRERLRYAESSALVDDRPRPHYGEEIFVDDGPRTFADYVGQGGAIRQLKAAIVSARARGDRLPHIALTSGAAGLGKTSLARLIANEMGVGIFEITGKITTEVITPILLGMKDRDILFIDEIHLLMGRNASGSEEWLLSLMEGATIPTDAGRQPVPNITVVGATTEFGKLKPAWQSRFMVRPVLHPYSDGEALGIARSQALRAGFGTSALPMPEDKLLEIVASAANNSPRAMKPVLIALRDAFLGESGSEYDIDLALEWTGLTRDGLDATAVEYLLALVHLDGLGSETSIKGVMGEPGSVAGTEQLLQQRSYMRIEGRGRQITEQGARRARELAAQRGLA